MEQWKLLQSYTLLKEFTQALSVNYTPNLDIIEGNKNSSIYKMVMT